MGALDDQLEVIPEREMNSFQKTIPALRRHDPKTSTIRQHYYPEGEECSAKKWSIFLDLCVSVCKCVCVHIVSDQRWSLCIPYEL